MWRFQLIVLATLAGPVAELLVMASYSSLARCWSSWGKYSLAQNVKFQQGDHILQSLVPVPYAPLPPSHVFFAVSDNQILHIEQSKEFPDKTTPYPVDLAALKMLTKNRGTRVVKPDRRYRLWSWTKVR
ncbi:unnamed protein product [Bemisia tabaci]|uniref:Uncharacterized protein n=1 Tax=Bemisia tabaci TaxID=7038 RepID=A0A9P0F6C0_BEMTA|nr:unnamed protein product [Bemisia tabaci]